MNIRTILTDLAASAFEACGYDRKYGTVTASSRPDLCQYQCNGAMAAAKAVGGDPFAIAGQIAAALGADKRFLRAEAVRPGFVNLVLSDDWIVEILGDMTGDDRLLLPVMEPETIVIDYGGPNLAKPLHVGHLRTAIIGDALCRLCRFLGHNVIGDIHLGDWGLQMGLVICELRRDQPNLPYFDSDYSGPYPEEPPFTALDLNTIYPTAAARAKTDADFAAQAAKATVELQAGRPGYHALWRHIWKVSTDDHKRNYAILGVEFDKWLGESDADAYVPRVIELLEERGLLRESEGAKVVDVALPEDKEPMPPIIMVKSDGGDMYGTTDVATILQRVTDWDPDEMWYCVDSRQSLHFKQVFRCAKLIGLLDKAVCTHVNNGTMNGKDGKPYKTREGGVMRLQDLIETVTAGAQEKVDLSEIQMTDDERRQAARVIGVAALKVGDLMNHRTKDYVFDLDRFLAADGKTGPYLQYAVVRSRSILTKAGDHPVGPILPPASDSERQLALALMNVPEALLRAFAEKAPNVLCEAMFDVAGVFSRFYTENKILIHPDPAQKSSWLAMLQLTGRMLTILLSLLGIQVPESM